MGGQDELAWSIGFSVAPYIHWVYTGGLRGGLSESNTETLINSFIQHGVTRLLVETNMGHGLFEINLQKSIADKIKELEKESQELFQTDPTRSAELQKARDILGKISIESEYSTDQKERRIIDSLVSTMQRHFLVVHESVIHADIKYNAQYGTNNRNYSVFYQMENITTDRGSLRHDDRLESLAGLVRMFKYDLLVDSDKAAQKRQEARGREFLMNPTGLPPEALKQVSKDLREPSRGTRGRLGGYAPRGYKRRGRRRR